MHASSRPLRLYWREKSDRATERFGYVSSGTIWLIAESWPCHWSKSSSLEGVFSENQKQEMIRKLTDAMVVSIEGEKIARCSLGSSSKRSRAEARGIGRKALTIGRYQGHGRPRVTMEVRGTAGSTAPCVSQVPHRGDRTRIIGARPSSTRRERKLYEG